MTAVRGSRAARRAGREADDRGAATIFVVGLSVMLLVVAGLVVDGGLAINARAKAADDAEQAVRAGAQHIDVETLRGSGDVVLNAEAAATAARDFMDSRGGYTVEDLTVQGNTVQITVSRVEETALLSLIGIHEFTIRAQAQSEPVVGIDGPGLP